MKKIMTLLISLLLFSSSLPVFAQTPARINISPDIRCLQSGERVTFNAQVFDESGNVMGGASVNWSLRGPGMLSNHDSLSVMYQATAAGNVTLIAQTGSVSESISFTVADGKVHNVRVRVDPDVAGELADYYIFFETDECGILEPGDKIYIAFPTTTQLPAYYQCSSVTVNGIRAQYEVRTSRDANKSPVMIITVPNLMRTSTFISVRICNVVNPRGGNCYVLAVATSKQTQWVLSSPYSIRGSIITPPMVEVEPDIAGENASYTIRFKTSSSGRLSGGYGSFIMIEFPFGTQLPQEILPEHITVNGVQTFSHLKPEISGRTIKIFPQMVVIEDSDVVVKFLKEAGIGNPRTPDEYRLAVWTSSDTIRVLSQGYRIRASSIEDVVVEVDRPYIQTLSAYKVSFTTGLVGRLNIGALITIYFPSSMTVPENTRPGNIRINGVPTIRSPIFQGRSIIRIPTPVDIEAQSRVVIEFTEEFGLINPPDPRRYHVEVQTAREGTLVRSNEFVIGPSVVGDVSVRLTMPFIGVSSGVELSFVTGGGGQMKGEHDRIYIVFPRGMHIPNAMPRSAITIQGKEIPITPFIKRDEMEIMLHVPTDIPANSTVVVRFDKSAGLRNPEKMGFYRFQIATSREVSYIESPNIEITESTLRNVAVNLLHNTINENAQFKVQCYLGDAGALEPNDKLRIFFDDGFVLPSSVSQGVALNSVPLKSEDLYTDKVRQMVEIKLREPLQAGSLVVVEFFEDAGIRNPSEEGEYTLGMSSSRETRTIASSSFKIIPLPVTEFDLDPPTPDGEKQWYINEPSLTLSAVSEDPGRAQTFISINDNEWVEYVQPVSFSSGKYTIQFFTQHSDSAKEKPQSIQIQVDTQPPLIQLEEALIHTNQNPYPLSITVIESWFDYAMINTHRVESLTEGRIQMQLPLEEGENHIVVLVYDQAGHRSKEEFTIILDTSPPELKIHQPLPWSRTIRKRIWVTGTTDPNAAVVVNEVNLPNKEGHFEGFVPLKPGLNSLNFSATDQAGNQRNYTLPVQYAHLFRAEIFIGEWTAETSFGEVEFDAPSFIQQGYTMVPLRIFAEWMGFLIDFESVFQIITLQEPGGATIQAQVGNTTFTVNEEKKLLPVPPLIRNGRTFVPLRFFAEEFGFEVSYNEEAHSVVLEYRDIDD